ncbi:hypothetical protein [Roseivirga sp. UBA838]|uniref:hypothetical protein n=1 Tax=Roseivirga sp. UBA838 TaxID=1947393 RepID=UPI00257A232A|nr:hypothetical protein [Roseivirga sp. UBA838]|tara:strand:+ start:11695 stop:12288 length:594 start_codon:yes stop_codon:yes gene_type:complete
MNSRIEHIAKSVASVYAIKPDRLLNLGNSMRSKGTGFREAISMFIYTLYQHFSSKEKLAQAIGLSTPTVKYHIDKIEFQIEKYIDVEENHIKVMEALEIMTIRLNSSQQMALLDVLNLYLNGKAKDVAEELIMEHIDEVYEHLRKRIKKGTANLLLSSKQEKAFTIWYMHNGYQFVENTYAYNTIQQVIAQLKPIVK